MSPRNATERSDWKAIAEALQLDVIVGRLQLKEHLVEDQLIERFGGSRYAVRRAIDELQTLGLVVRTENKGARIRGYSAREVAELFELRELLESNAASRIPMPAPAGLVERLTGLQKQHDAASRKGDYFRMYTLNNEFHDTLYAHCGNGQLASAIAMYSLRAQPIRMRFVHDKLRRQQVSDEHWAMIHALEQGDAKKLSRLCGQHIALTKKQYIAHQQGIDPQTRE